MKFRVSGTEFLDWQEAWCLRCEKEHDYSHTDGEVGTGCPLIVNYFVQEDESAWEPRDPEWWRSIPAEVSCSQFVECGKCAPEAPDAERRGDPPLTHREWVDAMRAETLARPVCAEVEA